LLVFGFVSVFEAELFGRDSVVTTEQEPKIAGKRGQKESVFCVFGIELWDQQSKNANNATNSCSPRFGVHT
jgi:hypothetical protein